VLDPAEEAVGTATAWVDDLNDDPAVGRVHWVALVPTVQGRGLAKPLMTAVCHRLQALGHRRAYLTTSMARTAAIGLYLKFGFHPVLEGAEQHARWQIVVEQLRRPESSEIPIAQEGR